MALTDRQREIATLVAGGQNYPGICQRLGIAKSRVHQHLSVLKRKGIIDWKKNKRGTFRIVGCYCDGNDKCTWCLTRCRCGAQLCCMEHGLFFRVVGKRLKKTRPLRS